MNFISPAFAQSATNAAAQAPFTEVFMRMLPMFAIVFVIFYFLVIKPQQNRLKQQESLINSLKNGDQVVTSSGIIGRVAGVEKDYILLEVSSGLRLKVTRDHVSRRFESETGQKKAA